MKSKKILIIFITAVVLLTAALSACTWMQTQHDGSDSPTLPVEPSDGTSPEPLNNFEWLVEPAFEYEYVTFDAACLRLAAGVSGEFNLLDNQTGKITNEEHGGHGGGDSYLAANKDGIYGIYNSYIIAVEFKFDSIEEAVSELKKFNPNVSDTLAVILFEITGDKLNLIDDGEFNATIEKIAYTNNGEFITDYIFNFFDENQTSGNPAVCKVIDGAEKYGFINNSGEQIIDFIFDGAVSIDDETAFVKQDGKWGIIRKTLTE